MKRKWLARKTFQCPSRCCENTTWGSQWDFLAFEAGALDKHAGAISQIPFSFPAHFFLIPKQPPALAKSDVGKLKVSVLEASGSFQNMHTTYTKFSKCLSSTLHPHDKVWDCLPTAEHRLDLSLLHSSQNYRYESLFFIRLCKILQIDGTDSLH